MIKRIILFFILCGISQNILTQNFSVEKSLYGIQTGFLGIWIHNEARLASQFALRTEIGFDSGLFGGSFYPSNGYILTPTVKFEPRWYYNLDKRITKGKNISKNQGNFLTIQSSYNPKWFVISNFKDIEVANQISIIPTWGIRRLIGKNFIYETGLGIGLRHLFLKQQGFVKNETEVALNLHLRIGYQF